MHKYNELKIWQKAMKLTKEVYKTVSKLPKDEKYGLSSQIRRSAVSIPSNIAEGAGRNSNKEFLHFLSIAQGSSYELQTQLLLTIELNMISKDNLKEVLNEIEEVQKMNFALQKNIKSKI